MPKEDGNKRGPKPTWSTPKEMFKDFDKFVKEQTPHKVKTLRRVKRIKKDREHIKGPRPSDYEWAIEEVEDISEPGIVSIVQFAAWKGVHRTTITTGYSEGDFKETYQRILAICEAYWEKGLYDRENRNSAGTIFAGKNAYGWTDKTELELSGSINQPLSDEARAILDKATRANGDAASES